MKLQLSPGTIHQSQKNLSVPPSKSMAHRAMLAAALATGTSRISNLIYSQDMEATLAAVAQLGATVERGADYVEITGNGGNFPPVTEKVDCGESGSTLRFLIPLFTLANCPVCFTGRGRLMQRPQQVYQDLFQEKGLEFHQEGQDLTVSGTFVPGDFTLDGSVSSQFITGLLYTLPLLPGESRLHITAPFESRSYVELTRQTLSDFSVETRWEGEYTLVIPGNQKFCGKDYVVEGDCSQAAFWAVLGAVAGNLSLSGIRPDTLQGDRVIFDILEKAGATCTQEAGTYRYEASQLQGVEIDLADCPDLGPILMVMGLFAQGETKIYNAGRLRVKESDRIAAMESEITKMGGKITVEGDSITLRHSKLHAQGALTSHNDHRIAMAMTVAAMLSSSTITLEEAESVEKSYPHFYQDLASCGATVE